MRTKIIVVIFLLMIGLFLLTSCGTKYIDDNGIEQDTMYGLVKVKYLIKNVENESWVAYDIKTKVCYLIIDGFHLAGITPYYIIGEDGKPEIAIYGQNYKGE